MGDMMEKRYYETEFLCIGGGIAGLMAAIRAADHGMKCIVIDKSNAKRSGSSGLGNDHFICYLPEVHGDYEVFINDVMKLQNGARIRQMGPAWARAFFFKTGEIVRLWDEWGISMKHNGEYYFAGHALPGRTHAFLKYNGVDQKVVLVKQAQKRGVEIHNRCMGYELLLDGSGRVAGAVAVDTREKILHIYRASAVCLGTGLANGVYPFNRLGSIGMNPAPINLTGDGRMMAYRAGAELCNLEMPHLHSGAKYFSRSGQATWEGVLRDPRGKPVGPFFTKPEPLCGDITMEVDKSIIERFNREGKGPVFMDMTGLTRDQLNTMEHWLKQEGNCTLLRHLQQEGVDLIDTAVEFATYPMSMPPAAGIAFNDRSETCVNGLYAAGDEGYGGIAGAAVTGWWAADAAAEYVRSVSVADPDEAPVTAVENRAEEILSRRHAAHWTEARYALQNIANDYCGETRTEDMLSHGLRHLRNVHRRALETLGAATPHELGYCLGVLNLYELAELMFLMAEDRRETRGLHRRPDYPLPNLTLDGLRHYIRREGDKNVMTWR